MSLPLVHSRVTALGLILAIAILSARADTSHDDIATRNLRQSSFDDLMFHASRYATTPEKRKMKDLARAELKKRGARSLHYLVSHSWIRNIWFTVYAREMVDYLPSDQGVPVLLELLDAPRPEVRKTAAFLLGFYHVPEYAERLLPLLEDKDVAGAAIRTLGKWQAESALSRITVFLEDDNERRRILAVNALGDIASPKAIPSLLRMLDDPACTVRRAAVRALVKIGRPAERPALRELDRSRGRKRREVIRVLAYLRSRRAVPRLLRLLSSADCATAADAARALAMIQPSRFVARKKAVLARCGKCPCLTLVAAGFPPLEQRD